jgi:2-oxoglutarate ferredoxin oxidoreductase subunit beta
VFRQVERPVYGEAMTAQIEHAVERLGPGSVDKLLHSGDTWTVS